MRTGASNCRPIRASRASVRTSSRPLAPHRSFSHRSNLVEAARRVGVKKIVMMSFLRARPNCGSPYHESKWAAEEIVRTSGLDYTIIKAGMVYGAGTICWIT
jgi:uncharacterized protein YbjT (DUF2867 family)